MKLLFWVCLAILFYTYLGYPLLIWVLACARRRPWHTDAITPSVSIVLAVHNGAAMLSRKILHLLDLDYSNIREIILVSDGSNDGTEEILARVAHPLIKSVILREHSGKAVAVTAGAARATGDILLFVDIRPEIAPGAVQKLVSNFADPEVGCVAGELLLRREGSDVVTGAVGGLYWRYEQWIRKCESAIDSPVGVYGGFYAIRRELMVPQPSGMILDDMFQPLSVIRKGCRSVLDPKAIVYDRWPKSARLEFQRKVRTLAGNFQLFRVAPWTLTMQNRVLFQLISHKLLRLIAPYLMTLLLISAALLSLHSRFFAFFAAGQMLSLVLGLIGLKVRIPLLHKFCAPASALLVLNGAAIVGLYKFCFTPGPLWKIWTASGHPIHDNKMRWPAEEQSL